MCLSPVWYTYSMDWVSKYVRGEAVSIPEFLTSHAKTMASGRNILAWIATRAMTDAIRGREDEWSDTAFWPSYSLASDLLGLQARLSEIEFKSVEE